MNKKLIASLGFALALGLAGTAFAANPFVDVPAKHWSYAAVSELASAGIVEGYADGTFKGDKTLSRYELAVVVAKALAKEEKANAEQKALIEKLAAEYAEELDNLGVRVAGLEKKAAADSVNFRGEARIRYRTFDFDDKYQNTSYFNLRTRITATGKINDEWTYSGRLQSINDLRGSDGNPVNGPDDTDVTLNNVWVQGPLLNTTATIGRFDYFENYGLLIDSTLNGVNLAFGNKLKTNVFYGKDNNSDVWGEKLTNKLEVYGAALRYGVSPKANLTGGYYSFKDNGGDFNNGEARKVWEAGFDTLLAKNVGLRASYGSSDADSEDKAYFAQVNYKGTDIRKPGSFGSWINYRHLEANAAPYTTFNAPYAFGAQSHGGKGYEIGVGYVPAANILWRTYYVGLKPTTGDHTDTRTSFFQTQVEVFF